jgi:hypothetical protein
MRFKSEHVMTVLILGGFGIWAYKSNKKARRLEAMRAANAAALQNTRPPAPVINKPVQEFVNTDLFDDTEGEVFA